MTAEQAINSLKSKNLNINIEGSGKVISQSPINGTELEEGSIISVTLMDEIKDAKQYFDQIFKEVGIQQEPVNK